jgi:hypothetical protein
MYFDCAAEITELMVNEQFWWSIGFDLLKGGREK